SIVGKQSKEEKCPTLRPEGLRIGQELTLYPIARLNWTGVQLTNSIKGMEKALPRPLDYAKNNIDLIGYPLSLLPDRLGTTQTTG
ncbi:MAG: hypothetical protein VB027_10010, partial [Gordonibacter sp.]|nr:hypothetical protein [Gordonibacter sp.]